MSESALIEHFQKGYSSKGAFLKLGAVKYQGKIYPECSIGIPLKMLNRHGLIAGATGTGKTKTLQVIAEGLSLSGIPSAMLDIKGDLSGLGVAGERKDFLAERYALLHEEYVPGAFPTEFLSLSEEKGTRLKATVTEFGPVLLSKILELNDTQQSLLSVLFKYADDHQLPLIDLKDLIKLIQYCSEQGKAEIERDYGKLSAQSLGIIQRKIIELQQQGADLFFGELSFEVNDLMRLDASGKGMINIIRVTDLQDRPKMFSTFMLQMLAELYETLPEVGDLDKPKLVIFIDEAHLIFKEASKALLNQIESVIKLIRSKGVGIFFVTQNPMDVPACVVGLVGVKDQHALRACTASDRKAIKQAAENCPLSVVFQVDQLLTELGIGEALITGLNDKGIPTPVAHTFLLSPKSRMDILSEQELDTIVNASILRHKYNTVVDTDSAYELLLQKMQQGAVTANKPSKTASQKPAKEEKSWIEKALSSSAGKQAQRSIVRTFFDILKKSLR